MSEGQAGVCSACTPHNEDCSVIKVMSGLRHLQTRKEKSGLNKDEEFLRPFCWSLLLRKFPHSKWGVGN